MVAGGGRQFQFGDEGAQVGFADAAATGERLEPFVGRGQTMPAHDRLDRLGQHLPGGVEVGRQALRVGTELAEAACQRIECDQGMPEGGAERPQHGRVGQVALPAADRQLFGEMAEHGIGEAEVAFGVLEVDRVDLVWHGRGTDLARAEALSEVAECDVAPDVATEVDGDGVAAALGVAQLGDAVVRFDLGGVGVEHQPEAGNETLGEAGPIDFRVGAEVRVVVADRAIDLADDGDPGKPVALAFEPGDDVGDFLADRSR